MLGRTYDDQVCSIARALEVVGERWSLLIVRDALLGLRRFDEFQGSLGIARNVLTDRLNKLVEQDVFRRVRYQDRPARYEYRLTPMGEELFLPLLALMYWGDRHLAGEAGPPRVVEHAGCGGVVVERLTCSACGETVPSGQVRTRPGPALAKRFD
ncbi:MAG: transcriptional regulator [Streptosporangiales bacterium]|nr:transcriptional regulator [Streptosporangiales bacterium]